MAQAWPSKPISLIVPFPPGGTTDVLARALADKLSQSLGQPVIVESKPGAGATLGADYVAKAKPDGYTLLVGAVHHTIATSVYKKLPYDFQKDFAPITTIALVPNVLVVNAATPAKNVAELVALAKAQPGKLNYGSNGNGTAQHLIGTQFENLTGTDTASTSPTRAAARWRPTCSAARSRCRSTPSRRCCSTSRAASCARWRSPRPSAPRRCPTCRRSTRPGSRASTSAPGSACSRRRPRPRTSLARLNAEMVKVIQSPEFRKRMDEIGAEPIGNSADQMAQQIKDETEKFAKLVKDAKVTIE